MTAGLGGPDAALGAEQVRQIIAQGTPEELVRDRRVLVLTPDATRSCPLPMMVRAVREVIGPLARRLDFMIALGSHHPLDDAQVLKLYGISPEERGGLFRDSRLLNHRWDVEGTLTELGRFGEEEIEELTGGMFREAVTVDINRAVYEYDLIVILGPVFPHEVIGFSGGNKYLFPGISGGEFLHFFHWLSAVITCWKTIGVKDTPVRELVNRAARKLTVPRHCIAMVVAPASAYEDLAAGEGGKAPRDGSALEGGGRLAGLFVGSPEEAWSRAADLSAQIHVVYEPSPYRTVLGRAPEMYDEVWVGGKVMYKLEPVVAEGGRLIIYAPHIREVSSTWGSYLERVGYHVRDYFLAQMERFRDVPRGVLAHSTHVKGLGSYENGVEKPRIEVVLATGISEETCRRINLGYMDPARLRVEDYQSREEQGVLFVDHAGEVLHRLEGERP